MNRIIIAQIQLQFPKIQPAFSLLIGKETAFSTEMSKIKEKGKKMTDEEHVKKCSDTVLCPSHGKFLSKVRERDSAPLWFQ